MSAVERRRRYRHMRCLKGLNVIYVNSQEDQGCFKWFRPAKMDLDGSQKESHSHALDPCPQSHHVTTMMLGQQCKIEYFGHFSST